MSAAQRIVCLDRASVAAQTRRRAPSCSHAPIEHKGASADQAVPRLAGATIATLKMMPISGAMLEQLPQEEQQRFAAADTWRCA